jgi:hypothetical protein
LRIIIPKKNNPTGKIIVHSYKYCLGIAKHTKCAHLNALPRKQIYHAISKFVGKMNRTINIKYKCSSMLKSIDSTFFNVKKSIVKIETYSKVNKFLVRFYVL